MNEDDTGAKSNNSTQKLNKTWLARFAIFRKLGLGIKEQSLWKIGRSVEYKRLDFKERFKINWNFLGFLFGPLYYFYKKMWARGAVILGASWVLIALLTLFESVAGVSLPGVFFWTPPAALCASMVNYDYFRHVEHGEKMWRNVPAFLSKPSGVIGFMLAVLTLVVIVEIATLNSSCPETTRSQMLEDISGVWRPSKANEFGVYADATNFAFDLSGETKEVSLGEPPFKATFKATVKSVDLDDHVVSLAFNMLGIPKNMALRKLCDSEGRFHLLLTNHDGDKTELSYVKDL